MPADEPAVVGVVFELGEQVRFRNAIDPLVIAIGGWLLAARLRSLRQASPTEEPAVSDDSRSSSR